MVAVDLVADSETAAAVEEDAEAVAALVTVVVVAGVEEETVVAVVVRLEGARGADEVELAELAVARK